MGVEVHITCAESWLDSEQYPISLERWLEIIRSDTSLQVCYEDYYGYTDDTRSERLHPIEWLDHPSKPQFWHIDGEITVKNPDARTLRKMAEIAQKLDATVMDDDCDEYTEEDGMEDVEIASDQRPKKSWWQKLFRN